MKVPRFDGLSPASELTSRIKARVKRHDTGPEMKLRRELWRRGFRYRLNARHLVGKPDLVFSRDRVVVFCDGDFWHGRGWKKRNQRLTLGANAAYWIAKIESNIARDRRVTAQLRAEGWLVIRLWEGRILADPARAVALIVKAIVHQRGQP